MQNFLELQLIRAKVLTKPISCVELYPSVQMNDEAFYSFWYLHLLITAFVWKKILSLISGSLIFLSEDLLIEILNTCLLVSPWNLWVLLALISGFLSNEIRNSEEGSVESLEQETVFGPEERCLNQKMKD